MTWETELAKAENDVLRTGGDLKAILAKFSAPTGPGTWSDAPQLEALELCQLSLATWTESQMNAFRNQDAQAGDIHLIGPQRQVGLTQTATRTWVQANVTADEWAALEGRFLHKPTLAETLSLSLDKTEIRKALLQLPDSPLYARKQATQFMSSLKVRVMAGELTQTSLANLQTINSILGT